MPPTVPRASPEQEVGEQRHVVSWFDSRPAPRAVRGRPDYRLPEEHPVDHHVKETSHYETQKADHHDDQAMSPCSANKATSPSPTLPYTAVVLNPADGRLPGASIANTPT